MRDSCLLSPSVLFFSSVYTSVMLSVGYKRKEWMHGERKKEK